MVPKVPLVQNKRSFTIAVILLFTLIALLVQYPGPHNNAEVLFQWLGIPLYSRPQSETGLHYSGIFSLALLLSMLTFFSHALSRHRVVIFFTVLMLLSTVPEWLVNGYQRIFASGVYAIALDPQDIQCSYTSNDQQMTGSCHIPLTNLSNNEIQVYPMLHFPLHHEGSFAKVPVTLPPLTIMPHRSQNYSVDFNQPLEHNSDISGHTSGLAITLTNAEQSRTWE